MVLEILLMLVVYHIYANVNSIISVKGRLISLLVYPN